jgi:hypothetical protein
MVLKTRQPTGRVPWPLILVEGGEKSGKSWAIAELSASPRVGQTYWIDLAEGAADEYGAVPGARYLIVEHDGTFAAILQAVIEIKALAAKAAAAGEPPIVLGIDSMTAEWELLKGQADARARQRLAQKKKTLAPDQEPQISMDLWNEANTKHRKLMTHLMTFPGIVVMTARGKEVAALDDGGKPIEGAKKEYRVEGQKGLAFDATVWLRLQRGDHPVVVGARSVHAGVRPNEDRPRPAPGLTLEKVVFDVLKCDPAEAHVRDLVELSTVPEDEPPAEAPADAPVSGAPTGDGMSPNQRGMLFALLGKAELADRDNALRFINQVLAPDKPPVIESTKQLTRHQARQVIDRLQSYIQQNTPPAEPEPAREPEMAGATQ